jgi:6-phosphogluconolactonase (cycloisomerase 2 family)
MAQPHDIRFNPDGTRLIVTEGGTHQIDIFELSNAGVSTGVITQRSAGDGPFGFTFGRNGAVLSTEAVSNSLSSYWLTPLSMLDVISDAVPSTQMATCWISLTRTGQVGFVSNTASGTLSSYTVDRDGTVHRANAVAASLPGGAPIDSSLTNDSAYLYVVDSAMGRIFGYRVNGTGLQSIGITTGLPKTVQGIAAR